MARGPEARFQSLLRGALDQALPWCWHFKAHGSVFQSGIPDLIGSAATYGAFGWELKATGEGQVDWSVVSELQRLTLKAMRRAGAEARVMFYHERLRVVLSPDADHVPPRAERWTSGETDAFAAGVLAGALGPGPGREGGVRDRDLLAWASGARPTRGSGPMGVAWQVYANGEGWRVARVAPSVRSLPLDLVLALGFGRRALEVAPRKGA